jgi:FixJ family two-component response regulator
VLRIRRRIGAVASQPDVDAAVLGSVAVARAARAADAEVTVVVVTGYPGSPAAAEALAAGARRIIGKPLDYETLLDELGTAGR